MTCTRCNKNETVEGKNRCEECRKYAREWQKNKTKADRDNGICITSGCKSKSNGMSRCSSCTEAKSKSYFNKKMVLVEA